MGCIKNIVNKSDETVEVTLDLNLNEIKKLKGTLDKIHLFSKDNLDFESKIVQRGQNDSTKYFLIPKEINSGILARDDVTYSLIEDENDLIFVFGVNKF